MALLLALSLVASLTLAACTTDDTADDGELTIFAAASLRDVFGELERAWEVERGGPDLVVAFDGSNVLAAQIAEGAPADVFVSADIERPDALVEGGEAAGEVVVFAGNGVTLVAPRDSDRVQAPDDLAEPGVRLVAAGPGVPISRYAEAAVQQLAETTAQPDDYAAAVAANVVSREDNVRAALAKVELGEGDAAFVYATDAASSEMVREIPLGDIDVVAEYGAVAVSERAAASDFVAWLVGPEAGAILEAAGFEAAGA